MFLLWLNSNTDGRFSIRTYSAYNKESVIDLAALEKIQIHILKELLNNKDHTDGLSTRFIFLHKFREFLKEHVPGNIRTTLVSEKNAMDIDRMNWDWNSTKIKWKITLAICKQISLYAHITQFW